MTADNCCSVSLCNHPRGDGAVEERGFVVFDCKLTHFSGIYFLLLSFFPIFAVHTCRASAPRGMRSHGDGALKPVTMQEAHDAFRIFTEYKIRIL